jgi:hypothetical protein
LASDDLQIAKSCDVRCSLFVSVEAGRRGMGGPRTIAAAVAGSRPPQNWSRCQMMDAIFDLMRLGCAGRILPRGVSVLAGCVPRSAGVGGSTVCCSSYLGASSSHSPAGPVGPEAQLSAKQEKPAMPEWHVSIRGQKTIHPRDTSGKRAWSISALLRKNEGSRSWMKEVLNRK